MDIPQKQVIPLLLEQAYSFLEKNPDTLLKVISGTLKKSWVHFTPQKGAYTWICFNCVFAHDRELILLSFESADTIYTFAPSFSISPKKFEDRAAVIGTLFMRLREVDQSVLNPTLPAFNHLTYFAIESIGRDKGKLKIPSNTKTVTPRTTQELLGVTLSSLCTDQRKQVMLQKLEAYRKTHNVDQRIQDIIHQEGPIIRAKVRKQIAEEAAQVNALCYLFVEATIVEEERHHSESQISPKDLQSSNN